MGESHTGLSCFADAHGWIFGMVTGRLGTKALKRQSEVNQRYSAAHGQVMEALSEGLVGASVFGVWVMVPHGHHGP